MQKPAARSAFGFLKAALVVAAVVVSFGAGPVNADGSNPLAPEVACTQIREAVHKVAGAERNQALALHLLADGKPTPMVQTRFAELQEQTGHLREVLRRIRSTAPRHNPDVAECLSMGTKSLKDAESISRQIQDIVMGEGGPLGLPPQIKSGQSAAEKLPEPPLPAAPSRAE